MIPLANHLWQSTLFAGVVMLLTLALRKNRAQMRYCLWLAASLKFLVPFSLLVGVGSQFEWRRAEAVAPQLSSAVEQISRPFGSPPVTPVAALSAPAARSILPVVLVAVWLCGFAVVLGMWWRRWRRISSAFRAASPVDFPAPIRVMSTRMLLEPGVFGIFRPVLLLPDGIANRLTPAQLQAILAHELCHVRRRDNLAAAIHMLVEAIFWFHPLVWWIGAQLIEERERACDEEVLRMGSEPQTYAEGILNVCKFYLESPLACASGVTGSDLKKRIEQIMTHPISHNLTLTRKLLLAAAAIMAIAGPVLIGVLNAPQSRAQSKPEELTFEVASIRPNNSGSGSSRFDFGGQKLTATNTNLFRCIYFAYGLKEYQISGPDWLQSETYDIVAKAASPVPGSQLMVMLQALLAERFKLRTHRQTKELPIYALVVGKNGAKLKPAEPGPEHDSAERGRLSAQKISMPKLAEFLSKHLGRPVLDMTNLHGVFDLTLEWADERSAATDSASAPSLFSAVQQQLGLKLEARKGPVEILIVDHAEKVPTEN